MPWPKGVSTDHLKVWTPEQEQYVKENYDGNGSGLAEILPFSGASIRNKAKRLGIVNHKHFHNVVMYQMPYINEADKYYIAGFFDGEGSLFRHQKGWRISIGNSDEAVIRWMRALFNDIGTFDSFPPRKAQHKFAYAWRINRQGEVWAFLEMFKSYLKIKDKLALVALEEFRRKFLNS